MKSKNHIHLITGLSGGGAEHLVLELAKQAAEHSVSVLVISVSSLNEIEHKFNSHHIDYLFLDINGFNSLFKGLSKLKIALQKNSDKSVVHCHMFHALLVALLYKLINLKKCNIVFTLHNNMVGSFFRRYILFISKPFRKIDIIFSKNSKKWYLKNNAIIPNGIDFKKFEYNLSEPRKINSKIDFIFLGSLTEQKNPLILPKLADQLRKEKINNFIIHVVGEGPLRNELEQQITNLKLQKFIILHGFKNNIPELLRTYNCQIMPSLWEGMPISLLESGAAGLPIITTPVGSIPDFLNNKNAYLSSPENFTNAMKMVIYDYNTALKKASVFKDFVIKNYSIENIYKKHQMIYDAI
ncbi:glycosyltransferase family 4 protein [Maribacter sp. CXY002]|uniref:glycosyltransferase family 4 protein n=1 Tax=Maribacter luteocoastalis TaxID=3407671 RepID=UPI003B67FF9E